MANAKQREAHEKKLRADYDKRKASLEAKYPNMKQFGISESIAALPTGRLDARGIEGHTRDAALVQKFQQEDKAKRVKELAAQRQPAFAKAAEEIAARNTALQNLGDAARLQRVAVMKEKAPNPKEQQFENNVLRDSYAGSNGMNAMASTITSSAPQSPVYQGFGFKKGGKVAAKKYAKGGKLSSAPKTAKASTASRRGDGIAQRGKTKGRMV